MNNYKIFALRMDGSGPEKIALFIVSAPDKKTA